MSKGSNGSSKTKQRAGYGRALVPFRRRLVIISTVLAGVGVASAVGLTQLNDARDLSIPFGPKEQLTEPIVTADGSVLVGRISARGAQVLEAQLDAGSAAERASLAAVGPVAHLSLATQNAPTSRKTLAVATSCPAGYGDQGEHLEIRTCLGPLQMTSVELDSKGRQIGPAQQLPSGLPEGDLLASDSVFVWDGFDPRNRAIYRDGSWHRLQSIEPVTTGVVDRCVSGNDFWVLHGNVGPRSLTGQDNALPIENRDYTLHRYRLDGSVNNAWESVEIPNLRSSDFSELACGDDETYVRIGTSLVSSRQPQTSIAAAEGIVHLRNHPSRRPVAFLKDFKSCAVLEEGGRLVNGKEPPSTVTSPVKSICDAVPWPTDRGLIAVSRDVAGKITKRSW